MDEKELREKEERDEVKLRPQRIAALRSELTEALSKRKLIAKVTSIIEASDEYRDKASDENKDNGHSSKVVAGLVHQIHAGVVRELVEVIELFRILKPMYHRNIQVEFRETLKEGIKYLSKLRKLVKKKAKNHKAEIVALDSVEVESLQSVLDIFLEGFETALKKCPAKPGRPKASKFRHHLLKKIVSVLSRSVVPITKYDHGILMEISKIALTYVGEKVEDVGREIKPVIDQSLAYAWRNLPDTDSSTLLEDTAPR